MDIDLLLSRLDAVRGTRPKWVARCPSHEDKSPSLSLRLLDDGRILVHCHAGCGASDVMAALGLSLADLYPEGRHGEFMSKKHRQPENVPDEPAYWYLMETLQRERAGR